MCIWQECPKYAIQNKKLKYWQRQDELKTTTDNWQFTGVKNSNANTNYRIQKEHRWIENTNTEYKYAEYQEYRMNTDGLKTADNWQATGVEEWPELDFFSLSWICTFYCIVLKHCISHFLCCDFAHYISYIGLFCIFHTVTLCICAVCIAYWTFSAVSLRIKIDLLPRPSLSSQAAHHNLRAKAYSIKIQIRRISWKMCKEYTYEQECSKYWNWR